MRAVLILFLLLLAWPAWAGEFTPPRIVVSGEWSPNVTKDSVTAMFLAAKPQCVKQAVELTRTEAETDADYGKRQKATFIFCMAEEFARNGLSVYEDVPTAPNGAT